MTTSPDRATEAVGEFLNELQSLTVPQLKAVVRRVTDAGTTAADNVEWWLATAAVARDLRRRHRGRVAAMACHRASEAVLTVAGAVDLPHDDVVHTARAAGEAARALVAGHPPNAVTVLTRAWEGFLPEARRPHHPTAA